MHLMREKLRPLVQRLQSAHPGLLMQRGLPIWEEGEKEAKHRLVEQVANVNCPEVYPLAFERWMQLTQKEQFAHIAAKVDGRLFTGLALGGTLETGMTTHHTYGTPLIAGSSIKGAVRAYAESINIEADILRILFGAGDDDGSETAGSLIWHDAWWVPRDQSIKPFAKEVVTVHEQSYYSEKSDIATGTESPIPNLQIAIQGEFYFVVEGEPAWARYAADLLNHTIQEQGLGAKTATGYGYFVKDSALDRYFERQTTELAKQEAKQSGDSSSLIRAHIESLDEKGLSEQLARGRKALLKELQIEENDDLKQKELCQIVMELHADVVATWESETKKSAKSKWEAYKYLQKYLSS
ncbi:hypothetical protein GCM10007162_11800 [Ignatzschineria ureiclastica]|nr:hypothetical protein GCM10007162_11800 [Ignatzschineria ureiclastica]